MKAAFIVFDGMTAPRFIGFYDPITRLKSMKIIENFAWNVCAQSAEVTDDRGLFKADTVGTLEGYDMIVVPGGFGTRKFPRRHVHALDKNRRERAAQNIGVHRRAGFSGPQVFKGRRATTHRAPTRSSSRIARPW
jgi:cyclohexyl-isocyanide hydratase